MIKILLILLILIALGGLIAFRYRRQIQLALYFLKMFRKMRQMENKGKNQIESNDKTDSMLVQCAGCKNWIAENKALKMGVKSFYCSADCMEKSVSIRN